MLCLLFTFLNIEIQTLSHATNLLPLHILRKAHALHVLLRLRSPNRRRRQPKQTRHKLAAGARASKAGLEDFPESQTSGVGVVVSEAGADGVDVFAEGP